MIVIILMFVPGTSQDLYICACPKPGPVFPTSYVICHGLFLCSMGWGERRLVLLILVKL